MNPSIRIRRAGPKDADTLARLRYRFRIELDPPTESETAFLKRCTPWMEQRLREGTWLCWMALADDTAVGTIWLHIIQKLPNPVGHLDYHGYISSVYVMPEFRNAGIGAALLRACLAHTEAEGIDALVLWPTERSRQLYERHGFAVQNDLLERRGRTP
jgi:GNAT superfamily N-acetyltransferase